MSNDRGWLAEEIRRTSEAVLQMPNAEALINYAERRGESQNRLEAEAYRERIIKSQIRDQDSQDDNLK